MLYQQFKKHVYSHPNKTALIFNDKILSYQELDQKINTILLPKKPFTHIAVLLENSIEFVLLLLAASKYTQTLIPFPIDGKVDYDKFDIEYIYDNNGLKQIHTYKQKQHNAYIIVSTSGSTSDPKPILLTQEIKQKRISIAKESYELNADDKILIPTPLHHSLAQRGILLALTIGATAILMQKFNKSHFLELLEKEKITFTFAVSNQLETISSDIEQYNLSSIKAIVSTSYAIKKEIKKKLLEFLPIYECYGTSEIGCVTHLSPKDIITHSNSVGKILKGVEIKIQDHEILVKSPWAFDGYYKQDKITQKSHDNDGFFKTGDLGELIDGYLYYRGRNKELIKSGGISIYPIDIEKVLTQVDGVEEVAVIGIDDTYFGEIVAAIITGNVTKLALMKMANKHLTSYQKPLFYDIVERLPKSALGKIQKFKLKEKYKHLNLSKKLKGIK